MRTKPVATDGRPLYGAAELKQSLRPNLRRALLIAVVFHVAVIGGPKLYTVLFAHHGDERIHVVQKFKVLAPPPPPLSKTPPPPVATQQTVAPPSVGAPVPVPDTEAPKEQTIATQEEIATFNPNASDSGATGQLVIVAPQEDDTPKIGEFVYYEQEPVLISMPKPEYPELARDANMEGRVTVSILVDKDGTAKKTEVKKSVAMFDDSAVKAASQSRWKPAMNNSKPLAVWVDMPINFTLH